MEKEPGELSFWRKAWDWLDGNKTIIGLALLNAVNLNVVDQNISADWMAFIKTLIVLFTGVGVVDHARKGRFSVKKVKGTNPQVKQ